MCLKFQNSQGICICSTYILFCTCYTCHMSSASQTRSYTWVGFYGWFYYIELPTPIPIFHIRVPKNLKHIEPIRRFFHVPEQGAVVERN